MDITILAKEVNHHLVTGSEPEALWTKLIQPHSSFLNLPFDLQLFIFSLLFPNWRHAPETAPAWIPNAKNIEIANITSYQKKKNISDILSLQKWAHEHFDIFWRDVTSLLNIVFKTPYQQVCDTSQGLENPDWFKGGTLNIIDSCFQAPSSAIAITYEDINHSLHHLSYGELDKLSNQIANSLEQQGFKSGDAIAIIMPMTYVAVAIYLGIIKMGGVVVSIADSFSVQEISTRIKIANSKAVFTQDVIPWEGKALPLYSKVAQAFPGKIVLIRSDLTLRSTLTNETLLWDHFLVAKDDYQTVACDPMSPCNILFSSGTTGDPKAIIWNHTTPIKAASDAYFHQNVQPNDVLAWPTNLGWMMGPWLLFAALINQSTIALHHGAPKNRAYGEFIQNAKVTMLGVVPTLVANWRQSKCMENLDWHAIRVFSSTGECSNPEDMLYLMSLAHFKPVIEYCGGTEIGGAYLTSTVVQKNYPSLFSTPAMGLDFIIINESNQLDIIGEVALIPPSLGLSTALLNANHHQVYFDNMPVHENKLLRRHGDLLQEFPNGYFCILGRVDDTMNISGIKISAAEIERILFGVHDVIEIAAIAFSPPGNGPSELVIYASTHAHLDKMAVMKEFQHRINMHLNPLFKINDVVFVAELPKTASNKIMRRTLRQKYAETNRSLFNH